jgi:response regulator of citrate/malate metabolism
MKIKVLVAEDDLDVHKVVGDILHINFNDIEIERALDCNSLRLKIRSANPAYDLILLDQDQTDDTGKDLLEVIREEFPQVLSRLVIIGGIQSAPDIPFIAKPFSLDDFGKIVKQICVV